MPRVIRPDWWAWQGAVLELAPHAGVVTTAMVWARHCWSWQQGAAGDAARSRTLTAEQLAARHPRRISERYVRDHLSKLAAAGLLVLIKGHHRAIGNTYAPSLPQTGGLAPVSQAQTGGTPPDYPTQTGGTPPDYPTQTGGTPPDYLPQTGGLAPVSQAQTGGLAPVIGSDTVSPLADTPRAGDARATREADPGRGDEAGYHAVALLLREMDRRWGAGTAHRIAPGWRTVAERRAGGLCALGWTAEQLVDRLNTREWASASSPGRALMTRLDDLAEEPPPRAISEQLRLERAEAAARPNCDHGTPGGCPACFMCRRGLADEDGTTCTQCGAPSSPGDRPGATEGEHDDRHDVRRGDGSGD